MPRRLALLDLAFFVLETEERPMNVGPLIVLKPPPRRGKRPFAVVGFAAESRDLLENATAKLTSKGLDSIAANDISAEDAGFAVETNRVTLLYADGRKETLPLMSKSEVAETIIERLAALLE